jgi:DNA-binding response OmpR family regulator
MSDLPPFLRFEKGVPTSRKNNVLVISQEKDTRLLLKTLLEIWGFNTLTSDSLDNTLQNINKKPPNLIILDSVLPFETHLENIRQIRRHELSRNTPIIVLSGFSQSKFKNLSLEVGANGFFVKPLDFDFLEKYLKGNIERGL